jgi:flagellar protein FlbD
MILLTKLDGHTIAVNDDLVVFAESTPDTVVTMSSGQRILVREPLADLMERVLAFRRSTFAGGHHG